ncbi:unnamed protein product [Ceutorhynchus assimilis]|uniref:F-box domain-containing protein n=1 Tax=Ceutorhynchus assimilis TaxID=467358 RepID=A0A9N9MDW1_9CUCU|nr:unnamed protein product [Ceutorhynchus assimilis]
MYSLLPSIAFAKLPELPIEVWCITMRLLDSKSLLSIVRSSSFFSNIARGDPVLRQKVRSAIKEEKEDLLIRLTRPGVGVRTQRLEQTQLYSSNFQKKIAITKCPQMFRVNQKANIRTKTKKAGLKAKTEIIKSSRFNPYRL